MKSILEEFWYGNIDPQVDATRDNKEVKNLLALMMQNREKLCEKLNDEEKEILEKYDDCQIEMNSLIEREIFRYAVSLGMRLSIEALFLFDIEIINIMRYNN